MKIGSGFSSFVVASAFSARVGGIPYRGEFFGLEIVPHAKNVEISSKDITLANYNFTQDLAPIALKLDSPFFPFTLDHKTQALTAWSNGIPLTAAALVITAPATQKFTPSWLWFAPNDSRATRFVVINFLPPRFSFSDGKDENLLYNGEDIWVACPELYVNSTVGTLYAINFVERRNQPPFDLFDDDILERENAWGHEGKVCHRVHLRKKPAPQRPKSTAHNVFGTIVCIT